MDDTTSNNVFMRRCRYHSDDNTTCVWPMSGEIDIAFSAGTHEDCPAVCLLSHMGMPNRRITETECVLPELQSDRQRKVSNSFWSDFHVFAFTRNHSGLFWFIDHSLVQHIEPKDISHFLSSHGNRPSNYGDNALAPFDESNRFHLVITLGVVSLDERQRYDPRVSSCCGNDGAFIRSNNTTSLISGPPWPELSIMSVRFIPNLVGVGSTTAAPVLSALKLPLDDTTAHICILSFGTVALSCVIIAMLFAANAWCRRRLYSAIPEPTATGMYPLEARVRSPGVLFAARGRYPDRGFESASPADYILGVSVQMNTPNSVAASSSADSAAIIPCGIATERSQETPILHHIR
jgi:hypothetical protein